MNREVGNLVETAQGLALITMPSGWGGPDPDPGRGPEALLAAGLVSALEANGRAPSFSTTIPAGEAPGPDLFDFVAQSGRALADQVAAQLAARRGFLVLGGDHGNAIGTWSGACRGLTGQGPLGLIWVDAHMDSHVPATSPSGFIHGMPLACLLGEGDDRLTGLAGLAAAVRPEHVCLVGVRSHEPEEADLLARLGVRVFPMAEVRQRGFATVLDEAVGIATRETAGFGVSWDMDAFDPVEAPGVAVPVPGGLRSAEVLPALGRIRDNPGLLGLEVVEYSPGRDRAGGTADLAIRLVTACLAQGGQD